MDIAPFVGLEPDRNMKDMEIFHLHRSRIPTALFKQIVQSIDVMLVQYGPPFEHRTKEATSRFVSPVSVSHFSNHQCTHTFHGFTLRSSITSLRAALLEWSITSLAQQLILLQFFSLK
jgi:hypothetical protein